MGKADDRRVEAQAMQLVPLIPQLMAGFKTVLGGGSREIRPAGRPSPRHIALVMSLSEAGPAPVSELAARLNLTLTHTSQMVGELAVSGLVERTEDQRDRRRTIVSVAPGGRQLVDAVASSAAGPLQAFCASLTADEATQFIAQLTQLVSFLATSAARPD